MKEEGDSTGGIITCVVKGVPVGLGEPVFDKLHARLGTAMLSINAAHGFDYGSGFEGVAMKGSDANDAFILEDENVKTRTNHSGGIQGGSVMVQTYIFGYCSNLLLPFSKNKKPRHKQTSC